MLYINNSIIEGFKKTSNDTTNDCLHDKTTQTTYGITCKSCGLVIDNEDKLMFKYTDSNLPTPPIAQKREDIKQNIKSIINKLNWTYSYGGKIGYWNYFGDFEIKRICAGLHITYIIPHSKSLFARFNNKMERMPSGLSLHMGVFVYLSCRLLGVIVDLDEIVKINNSEKSVFVKLYLKVILELNINFDNHKAFDNYLFSLVKKMNLPSIIYSDAKLLYKKYRSFLAGKPSNIAFAMMFIAYFINYDLFSIKVTPTKFLRDNQKSFSGVVWHIKKIIGIKIKQSEMVYLNELTIQDLLGNNRRKIRQILEDRK